MREKKRKRFFFLQHLQVFFLKTKLISTSPSFLHKKGFITCAKYFFKKRDMNRFVPKNKSVSRGRAERIDETSDTQFSCLPQNGYEIKIESSLCNGSETTLVCNNMQNYNTNCGEKLNYQVFILYL